MDLTFVCNELPVNVMRGKSLVSFTYIVFSDGKSNVYSLVLPASSSTPVYEEFVKKGGRGHLFYLGRMKQEFQPL